MEAWCATLTSKLWAILEPGDLKIKNGRVAFLQEENKGRKGKGLGKVWNWHVWNAWHAWHQ